MSVRGYRLEGSSMRPVYKAGELALADSAARPAPGDCAVYRRHGRTLLHRVLSTVHEGAWLADDAGRIAPHFVPWADVDGRAVTGGPLSRGICGLTYSLARRSLAKLLCIE